MLIELLFMSRINYCCYLYYGIPDTSTKSLDRIIRSSIRVLHRVKLYDHESSMITYKYTDIYNNYS